jgi:hypothetical protein
MSSFICPSCSALHPLFAPSTGGANAMCQTMSVPFLGPLPLDPRICALCDGGKSITDAIADSPVAAALNKLVDRLSPSVSGLLFPILPLACLCPLVFLLQKSLRLHQRLLRSARRNKKLLLLLMRRLRRTHLLPQLLPLQVHQKHRSPCSCSSSTHSTFLFLTLSCLRISLS